MALTPKNWDVEDETFWNSEGKSIANRNLWISIPNLLCGFSVWMYWGMIVKIMQRLHFANTDLFNFTFQNDGQPYDEAGYRALLFTLPAVAGLAGATLRIPNSFMIAISGGRNVNFMTTLLLIIPAVLTGLALGNPTTSFGTFIVLAAFSGVGGGAFASSMSNISFFFPKRMQGLALGLNAGLGTRAFASCSICCRGPSRSVCLAALVDRHRNSLSMESAAGVDSECRAGLGSLHDGAGGARMVLHEQSAATQMRTDSGCHRKISLAAIDRVRRHGGGCWSADLCPAAGA